MAAEKKIRANRNFRRVGRVLEIAGSILGGAGALAVIAGGVLPWLQFTIFNVPVNIPGVMTWGAVTAMLGLLAFSLRRRPTAVLLLGIASFIIGGQAQSAVGREIVRRMLAVQVTLAPVNDRLARVALPPIEPFSSIAPAATYVGPGPFWTMVGGAGMAIGAALRFAGGRQARSCFNCGVFWPVGRDILFCPRCGVTAAAPGAGCTACHRPLEPRDKFCVYCGTPAPRDSIKA